MTLLVFSLPALLHLAPHSPTYPLGEPQPGGASQLRSLPEDNHAVSANGSFPDLAGIPLLGLPMDAQAVPSHVHAQLLSFQPCFSPPSNPDLVLSGLRT